MGSVPEGSSPNVKKGDAIVLTRESSASVLNRKVGEEVLVGLVLDLLSDPHEEDTVWGVLVNGELHQILDVEIAAVLPSEGA